MCWCVLTTCISGSSFLSAYLYIIIIIIIIIIITGYVVIVAIATLGSAG